jgi:hypothetical protein
MDQVRQVLRYHHYSYRTEQTYCDWIIRFVKFHNIYSRHGEGYPGGEQSPGNPVIIDFHIKILDCDIARRRMTYRTSPFYLAKIIILKSIPPIQNCQHH